MIDERMLCATLFRYVGGDSSLLLSTVVSLPCEVSTEALISDLELPRVSAETTNLKDGCALVGSVSQGYSKSRFNGSIQNCRPVLASESGTPRS